MGNQVCCKLFCGGGSTARHREWKLLIHGLDASGKTTILYKLKHQQEVISTIPTIGFNVESLKINGYEFVAWDVGGRDKLRPLWRHYYPGTDAVVFVVDSNDTDRMDQSRDEFHRILHEKELEILPVLLFCNKQDLQSAWSPQQVARYFQVDEESKTHGKHRVGVFGCCATNGEGLRDGLDWIANSFLNTRSPSTEMKADVTETSEDPFSDEEEDETVKDYSPDSTDSAGNATLERFLPIKRGAACPFAKSAKLWGGISFEPGTATIEDQAMENAPVLKELCKRLRAQERIDGFCVELDDELARTADPKDLGTVVCRMLTALSDQDPTKENVMRATYIGQRGWRFRFDRFDFFVTTFAPCYPATSSRYAFGSGRGFLLLQPELSFERHGLPPDTPVTDWDEPKTIRDKTRDAFKKAGCPYHIPRTTTYPAAEHIVKPLQDDGTNVVEWWKINDSH